MNNTQDEAEAALADAAAKGKTVIVWTLEDLEHRKNFLLSQVIAAVKGSHWASVEHHARDLREIEQRIAILQQRHALTNDVNLL